MANNYAKIENLDRLKELSSGEVACECFIWLNGGLRSSKRILYNVNASNEEDDYVWDIYNEIDDTEDFLKTDEIFLRETNIGKALETGNLYLYNN